MNDKHEEVIKQGEVKQITISVKVKKESIENVEQKAKRLAEIMKEAKSLVDEMASLPMDLEIER